MLISPRCRVVLDLFLGLGRAAGLERHVRNTW